MKFAITQHGRTGHTEPELVERGEVVDVVHAALANGARRVVIERAGRPRTGPLGVTTSDDGGEW